MSQHENEDNQISEQNQLVGENNRGEDVAENDQQFSSDFQSDDENLPQIDKREQKQVQSVPKVTNPISPYGIFTKQYRQKHAGQKITMSTFGQIWNSLGPQEKNVYQQKFKQQKQKYQEYQAYMLSLDPNFGKKSKPSANLLFPLHRVKAIMKQDNSYTASTQNVSALTRAVEYFGQFLLQQVKRTGEGTKRIDLQNLFEAVNNNQNNLWFLNCLIDEYNLGQTHSSKPVVTEPRKINQQQTTPLNQTKQLVQKTKKIQKPIATSNKKKNQLPKGQMKLTDMF